MYAGGGGGVGASAGGGGSPGLFWTAGTGIVPNADSGGSGQSGFQREGAAQVRAAEAAELASATAAAAEEELAAEPLRAVAAEAVVSAGAEAQALTGAMEAGAVLAAGAEAVSMAAPGAFGGGGGAGLSGTGAGGFGGGEGGAGISGIFGGGGLGAGGDIFVQQGGSLTIESGSLTGGSVTSGLGGDGGADGQAYGAGIFLHGDETLTFAPAAGATTTISDAISDMTGSHDASGQTGAGAIVMDGAGTLVLSAANTYTGGTTLEAGTLDLANPQAAGSGTITFAGVATLKLEQPAWLAPPVAGLADDDVIEFVGVTAQGAGLWPDHNQLLLVENATLVAELQLSRRQLEARLRNYTRGVRHENRRPAEPGNSRRVPRRHRRLRSDRRRVHHRGHGGQRFGDPRYAQRRHATRLDCSHRRFHAEL